MRDGAALGYCDTHGKYLYADRKTARKASRLHTSHKNPYRCSANPILWHIGELSPEVIRGHVDRDTYYQWAA